MTTTSIDMRDKYIPTTKQGVAHSVWEKYPLFGGAMGGGKSVFLAMEGYQLSLDFPGNRGFICRWENKIFKATTLREMLDFYPERTIARHRLSDQVFELINGSEIMYGGLKPSGGIGANSNPIDRIKSMKLGWFAIDEASEIPEEFFLILCSRLRLDLPGITYKGLCASNPEPGWVHQRWIEQKLKNHIFIPALCSDNPHNPEGYEEELRELFPDEWIAQYVDGLWTFNRKGMYVYPHAWVRAAQLRTLERTGPCHVGIDVGAGGDPTVAVARWGSVYRIIHTSLYTDTTETTDALASDLDQYQPETIAVDVAGLGKGPYDELNKRGYPVIAYNGGNTALDPERYVRRRSEGLWEVRNLLENGEPDFPDNKGLLGRMIAIKYELQGGKRILVESKKALRARGIPSTNILDAIAMSNVEIIEDEESIGKVLTHWPGRERVLEEYARLQKQKSNAAPNAAA